MELRQLEYFMAVAGEMSFSRAAVRVNVVQSALSTSIGKLERELGVQLFDRRRHRIDLTDAGEAFRERVGEVLRAADLAKESAKESAQAGRQGNAGTVNLGVLISSGPLDFVRVLLEFAEQNPQVRLRTHLYQTGSAAYLPALLAGTLDLALVSGPLSFPAQLEVHPLFEDPLVFVCRPDHPLARRSTVEVGELSRECLAGFPQESGLRNVVNNAFNGVGLQPPTHYELLVGFPAIAELIRRGIATALMPLSEARRLTDLRSIKLKTPVLWRVYLASQPLHEVTHATARLAEMIINAPGTVQHRDRVTSGSRP
ncbi:MAG: LysR family transcriptional regulator [Actinomycetia bacterium]|nr:LysR family transcriptional regulator [Actinomycetes bacterium]MCH9700439.1 LysR family transcriptional regulator [Actinomycetes bacterium]MCH9759763.1 LysR family transcriptional regulator [Actinomycetes bacterium]